MRLFKVYINTVGEIKQSIKTAIIAIDISTESPLARLFGIQRSKVLEHGSMVLFLQSIDNFLWESV